MVENLQFREVHAKYFCSVNHKLRLRLQKEGEDICQVNAHTKLKAFMVILVSCTLILIYHVYRLKHSSAIVCLTLRFVRPTIICVNALFTRQH